MTRHKDTNNLNCGNRLEDGKVHQIERYTHNKKNSFIKTGKKPSGKRKGHERRIRDYCILAVWSDVFQKTVFEKTVVRLVA